MNRILRLLANDLGDWSTKEGMPYCNMLAEHSNKSVTLGSTSTKYNSVTHSSLQISLFGEIKEDTWKSNGKKATLWKEVFLLKHDGVEIVLEKEHSTLENEKKKIVAISRLFGLRNEKKSSEIQKTCASRAKARRTYGHTYTAAALSECCSPKDGSHLFGVLGKTAAIHVPWDHITATVEPKVKDTQCCRLHINENRAVMKKYHKSDKATKDSSILEDSKQNSWNLERKSIIMN